MTDNAVDVSDDQSIWHYRQFAEFVAILQNQTLWFSRLDRLRDPFEGRSGRQSKFFEKADAHMRKGCVSCWTVDDDESELMWCAYSPCFGVAIRSTKGRLKASFGKSDADKIEVESVQYGSKGPFGKRRVFKREQELRAFIRYEYEYDRGTMVEPPYAGTPVPVELRSLMAEVWVSPNSPDWFETAVSVELEKYGYDRTLVKTRS
jgi:hypothetical protein